MEEKFIFSDNIPIYKQLLEQLTEKIIIGTYEPGSKLPSVREFALITGVNPNTVQRALTELEEKSLIITKRTSGKFVTEDKKIINKMKRQIKKPPDSKPVEIEQVEPTDIFVGQ